MQNGTEKHSHPILSLCIARRHRFQYQRKFKERQVSGYTEQAQSNQLKFFFFFFLSICAHSPLLGNYYFNPNRKMRSGFCSIVVKHVTKKHIGQWTCAGRLVGRDQESWDDFNVHVFDQEGRPTVAAISGMVIGAIVVLMAIGGVGLFTYRRKYMVRRNRITNDNISDSISESAAIPMGNLVHAVAPTIASNNQ